MVLHSALIPFAVAMAGHDVKHTNTANNLPISSKRLATPSAKKKALTEVSVSSCTVLCLHWTDTLITFLYENPETCLMILLGWLSLKVMQWYGSLHQHL